MSAIGERIAASIQEFWNGPLRASFSRTMLALKDRPLTPGDFQTMVNFVKGTTEAALEKLLVEFAISSDDFARQHPKDRRLEYFMLYMSVAHGNKNLLSPVTYWIDADAKEIYEYTNIMPLVIPSRHVEYRHIQRTSHKFQYSSDDTIFALLFSLPLNKPLREQITSDVPLAPFVIPHSRGLFLGEAFLEKEPERLATHARRGKKIQTMRGPKLELPVMMRINTFVSYNEMQDVTRRGQREVHSLLYPFREEKEAVDGLFAGLEIFSRGDAYRKKVSREKIVVWEALCARVENVMRSDAWQRIKTDGLDHFRRREMQRNASGQRPNQPNP